jgi:DNA-binding response OmpR family regulator
LQASLAGRFEIFEAGDGAAALALVNERIPDLVVSDVMMPMMDGFDLCRAIKGNPETEFIPVILLTARSSADSRVEGLGVGADEYLVKPFNPQSP